MQRQLLGATADPQFGSPLVQPTRPEQPQGAYSAGETQTASPCYFVVVFTLNQLIGNSNVPHSAEAEPTPVRSLLLHVGF